MIDYSVQPDKDYLTIDINGVIDYDVLRSTGARIAGVCKENNINRILINADHEGTISVTRLYGIGAQIRDGDFHHTLKVAIYCKNEEIFDEIAFLVIVAKKNGLDMFVSTDRGEAINWLLEEPILVGVS